MSPLTKWSPLRTSAEIEPWGPLTQWNPLRELQRMQKELDRVFDGGLTRFTRGGEAMTISEWSPSVDITEDEKEFVVKAELPDVKREDVKVTVEGDVLTIRGERKSEKEEKGKKFHRMERSYGSFERSFTMPDATEASKITSEYRDGLLTVHLPKNPAAKAKATEIKVQ